VGEKDEKEKRREKKKILRKRLKDSREGLSPKGGGEVELLLWLKGRMSGTDDNATKGEGQS